MRLLTKFLLAFIVLGMIAQFAAARRSDRNSGTDDLAEFDDDDDGKKLKDLLDDKVTKNRAPEKTEGDDDTNGSVDDKQILFAGKSGVVKIAGTRGKFTSIKFRRLIDSDGQRAKKFEDDNWTWTPAQQTTVNGLAAKNFTATMSALVGSKTATLLINGLIFSENGTIPYGNGTVDVYKGSVKISYTISNWPFKMTNSTLYLSVTVGSSGKGVNSTRSSGKPRVTVGDAFFGVPTVALVDNVVTPINVRYLVDCDSDQGSQAGVVFEFPYFANSLYYDPVSVLDTYLPNAASISNLGMISSIAAVLLVLANIVL
jgi:hypothetical protein